MLDLVRITVPDKGMPYLTIPTAHLPGIADGDTLVLTYAPFLTLPTLRGWVLQQAGQGISVTIQIAGDNADAIATLDSNPAELDMQNGEMLAVLPDVPTALIVLLQHIAPLTSK